MYIHAVRQLKQRPKNVVTITFVAISLLTELICKTRGVNKVMYIHELGTLCHEQQAATKERIQINICCNLLTNRADLSKLVWSRRRSRLINSLSRTGNEYDYEFSSCTERSKKVSHIICKWPALRTRCAGVWNVVVRGTSNFAPHVHSQFQHKPCTPSGLITSFATRRVVCLWVQTLLWTGATRWDKAVVCRNLQHHRRGVVALSSRHYVISRPHIHHIIMTNTQRGVLGQ